MSNSLRSLSQIWNKNQQRLDNEGDVGAENAPSTSNSRRQLSRQFNSVTDTKSANKEADDHQHAMLLRSRNVLSSINLNVGNVPRETRKLFQAGADKVNKTLSDVRSTLDHWSQKLKGPTRRRQRLISGSPYTPNRNSRSTPRTKQLLGRTPTKLYSPFSIETPSDRRQRNHQQFFGKPGTYTPTRNKRTGGLAFDPANMYSPTQTFPKDVENVRRGVEDFNRAAEGVVRRSLRSQPTSAALLL